MGNRRAAKGVVGVVLIVALSLAAVGAIGSAAGHPSRSSKPLISLASPRVVVLKSKRVLHLFDGRRLVRTYPLDLGRSPQGQKRLEGDGKTPEGLFHVVTKNESSPYHLFIGFDYPNVEAASWGLRRGLISPGAAAGIEKAIREGRCPDWSTALGGGIGIHGHARGADWTGGCVAVSDQHIEELFSVLRPGDPIEVLP